MGIFQSAWVNSGALVIVASAYILLWSIGKLLSFRSVGGAYQLATERKEYSTNLLRGLHVTGLSHPLLNEFNVLADKKDTLKLAMYLAIYQPSIQEVDEFVQNADELTNNSKLDAAKGGGIWELAHFESNSNRFRILDQDDLQSICHHQKKIHKLINKEFIRKFGNLLFMENFIMYSHLCRNSTSVFNIPHDNKLRRMFDTFVATGLATHGRFIPIVNRLEFLDLSEMQNLSDELDLGTTFESREEAVSKLADISKVSVRLARKVPIDNMYFLKKEHWDIKSIEEEWSAYNACAKLLCAPPTAHDSHTYTVQ